MASHFVGEVLELDRDCELGTHGERCVVTSVYRKNMVVVFPMRDKPNRREVQTGQDYTFLRGGCNMTTAIDERTSLLDLAPAPERKSALSPLANALIAVRSATTRADLERAIIPARAWPEGPDKARLRTELRLAEDRIKAASDKAREAQRAQASPILTLWPALWRSLAEGIYTDGGVLRRWPAVTEAQANEYQAQTVSPAQEEGVDDLTGTLEGEIAAIVENAQANAAVASSGSLAGGTMAGVGFTTADGYVTALAHGVKRATADGYIATLRQTYHYTESQIAALTVTIIADGPGPIDANPTVHTPAIDTAGMSAGAFRAHFLGNRALVNVAEATQTRAQVRQAISAREIVAGAKVDASGVLVGWAGRGESTRTSLRDAIERAGLTGTVVPPVARSPHAHAAAALTTLTVNGHVLRAERGVKVRRTVWVNGTPRQYVARWTVMTPGHGQVGDAAGTIVLTASLTAAGSLDCDGDPDMCARVRGDFDRRVDAEIYPAGEVTDWLRGVLVDYFGAVRLGGNWYVPHATAARAERLCEEVSRAWGVDWIIPALPVATTDQLCAGLARGLAQEADAVLAEFEIQRASARKDREGGDIGPKAAATLIGKLRDVNERARGYAEMLGARYVADVRAKIGAALAVIEPLCDGTVQRFAMLDLA